MVVSIGIETYEDYWKVCLAVDGHTVEFSTFADVPTTLAYIKQKGADYPQAILALASPLENALAPFATVFPLPPSQQHISEFVVAASALQLKSYCLPALKYSPFVPHYRWLNRPRMGTSRQLCAIATLLYRMRQQEASWTEMNFFYLEVSPVARNVVVINNGHVVDAMSTVYEEFIEQAFWEGLTQDLAGLMALYHLDDVVIVDHNFVADNHIGRDAIIDRFGDSYKFYLFPYDKATPEGWEVAIGASLIAEGLCHPGLAAEVVQRLLAPLQ